MGADWPVCFKMDGSHLFKILGSGAKFNFKRFERDAKKLNIQQTNTTNVGEGVEENYSSYSIIDSGNKKQNASLQNVKSLIDEQNAEEEGELTILGGIKSKAGTLQSKRKRKSNKSENEKLNLARTEKINQIRNK